MLRTLFSWSVCLSVCVLCVTIVAFTDYVQELLIVRWATGKRSTDRLPKPYNTPPLELTGYARQRVTNTWFQFLGIQKYLSDS